MSNGITYPDYFRTENRYIYHSQMGEFPGKKENFKMWHWIVRNHDKMVPDYVAYGEQYRWINKADHKSCSISVEASRCQLGKSFGTEEFKEELNKKIKSLKKRYFDSLNGILKHITLIVKIDLAKDIVELDHLIVEQYTFAASEKNNDPKQQWIYRKRRIKAGDFSYRFSPYIDDSKYWNVSSKNDLYLGVASFGVSESRSTNTYKGLNKYISYVVGELREWVNSIKHTKLAQDEIENS